MKYITSLTFDKERSIEFICKQLETVDRELKERMEEDGYGYTNGIVETYDGDTIVITYETKELYA